MTSPYEGNYGLKWPSSNIVSDVYKNIGLLSSRERGMDFGCGLGAHGRLMETLGFSEVHYVDNDNTALEKAKKFLSDFNFSGQRRFYRSLSNIVETPFDIVIDRAGLQHVEADEIANTLDSIAFLLANPIDNANRTQSGILISEWILSADESSQTKRFPSVIFYHQIEQTLLSKFDLINTTHSHYQRLEDGKTANFSVVNVVLRPRP